MRAVLLLSGGLDSTVLLYMLLQENINAYPLFIDYGQKSLKEELKVVNDISKMLGLKPKIIKIENLEVYNSSRLAEYYYPFRNLLLVSIASIYAYKIGADAIFLGLSLSYINEAVFPDANRAFLEKLNVVLDHYRHNIKVYAPLIDLDKATIVRIGNELNVPFTINLLLL